MKEKLDRLSGLNECSSSGKETKHNKYDSRRKEIIKLAINKTAIPFIVAISIAAATMVHIEDFRVFFISNSFVLLSYITEIVLYKFIFEPYPFMTDAELLTTFLEHEEK